RALDVEDLAADRKQGLELALACKLGGAKSRVAFDDEQLGAVDVLAAAISQLRGQGRRLECVFAPLRLFSGTGGQSSLRGCGDLFEQRACVLLVAALRA